MILEAKDALGRVPGLNEDLLDIQKNYFDKGDMFWLAVDTNDRVIGSIGYSSIDETTEEYAKLQGKTLIRVHLGNPEQWFESHSFYPQNGYFEYESCYMMKEI